MDPTTFFAANGYRLLEEELMHRFGGPLRLRLINPVTGEVIPNRILLLRDDGMYPIVEMVYHALRFGPVRQKTIPTWNTFKILIDDVPIASWADLFSTWGIEPTRTVGLVFVEDPPLENRVRWEDLTPDDLPLHLQPCDSDPTAFFRSNGFTLCEQYESKTTWYAKSS